MNEKTSTTTVNAIRSGKNIGKGSRTVTHQGEGWWTLYLHGSPILKQSPGWYTVNMCGWPTQTTRATINDTLKGLGVDAHVYQRDGRQFLVVAGVETPIGDNESITF